MSRDMPWDYRWRRSRRPYSRSTSGVPAPVACDQGPRPWWCSRTTAGVNNPKAWLCFESTVEQAFAAPTMIAASGLYDRAPHTDRAAALVLAAEGVADRFTDGAGVTAQLGAMRINEEIDALESMAIRPVSYLVSTRILAGMIAITPLYSIAVILSFLASQFTTVFLFGQSEGLCNHYFTTFLNPIDLLWSFLQAVLMALTILLIHTYFGYFASGGPSGVGVAVGNAVRTSLVVVVSVTLLVSLSIYGSNGNFNLSG